MVADVSRQKGGVHDDATPLFQHHWEHMAKAEKYAL
jgi:hypothetical protein